MYWSNLNLLFEYCYWRGTPTLQAYGQHRHLPPTTTRILIRSQQHQAQARIHRHRHIQWLLKLFFDTNVVIRRAKQMNLNKTCPHDEQINCTLQYELAGRWWASVTCSQQWMSVGWLEQWEAWRRKSRAESAVISQKWKYHIRVLCDTSAQFLPSSVHRNPN